MYMQSGVYVSAWVYILIDLSYIYVHHGLQKTDILYKVNTFLFLI